MLGKRAGACLLTVAVAAGAVVLGGGTPGAAEADEGVEIQRKTVTLVTGDLVTVGGPEGVAVRPARGREHVTFAYRTDEDGDLNVVPADVRPLLAEGRLDPRLFDVGALVRDGYAERAELPLIVDFPAATPRIAGTRTVRELPGLGAVAVRVDKDADFWNTAGLSAKRIWLDGRVRANLEHSVPRIGAPEAWAAGYTGEGTTVAVLDTGIDATHPDLAGAVVGEQDFTRSDSGTDDRYGHGTHVASIVTGAGERNRGVAPDAKLLNGKVLDDFGSGWDSDIIAGMEWAAASGADVVNMSLGSPFSSDGTDPMSLAVNQLTAETGTLFVVAAGNSGPHAGSIGSPAAADAALTVGAVDREDGLAEFSSRGPRHGDGAVKPDLTAPGVDIVAAAAANGVIGEPAGDGYVSLSGTSMATPHVAGVAAILAERHPDWTAERLKATLVGSATPSQGANAFEQGAGRVDVPAAIGSTVSASPASVSGGVLAWPYTDRPERTVEYTNTGTAPVTLDLAFDGDAGLFAVSPGQVTVPAGGVASATVTIDATGVTEAGPATATLVATGGGQSVRTPVGVTLEAETYDVTLRATDHDGAPTDFSSFFVDIDTGEVFYPQGESGTFVARLPKARYIFSATIYTSNGDPNQENIPTTEWTEPNLVVDRDRELVLDARQGEPVDIRVGAKEAEEGTARIDFRRDTGLGEGQWGIFRSNFTELYLMPSETSAGDGFRMTVEALLARPDGRGDFRGSPYLYHVRWGTTGGVPADLDRRFADRDLAKVRSTHAAHKPGLWASRNAVVDAKLPFTLTEYYTPDVPWVDTFEERTESGDVAGPYVTTPDTRVYRTGKVTEERWNTGVFGPAFPENDRYPGVFHGSRDGDVLEVWVPMFTDQNPAHEGQRGVEGSTELLRDGEPVDGASGGGGGGGYFVVPPDEATYTLRASAHQDALLSPTVSSEWTFRSAATDWPTAVGLLAVRFAPDLDAHNRAPAGKKFRVPLYMQRNDVGSTARIARPTVEVSYDDGRTWRPATVTGRDRWVAELDHPRGAKYVSLRTSVSDSAGNSAKHTITRAYALR